MDAVRVLRLLAIYVVLLGVDRIVPLGPLKTLTNAFAVAIPLILVLDRLLSARPMLIPSPVGLSLLLIMVALVGSWAVNGISDMASFTKILILPLFVMLGFNAVAFDRSDPGQLASLNRLFVVLLAVPLVLLVLNDRFPHEDPSVVSIFANRNTAALYMVGLANVLFLRGVRLGYIVVFLSLVALLFSTLGVLMAIALALVYSLGVRRYLGIYLLVGVVSFLLVLALPDLPILERLNELFANVAAVTAAGTWTALDQMTYLDLYLMTGSSTDLSIFFRLKHWQELWAVYAAGGWPGLLFGFGVGESVFHTDLALVPHNDYLRLLVEAGPLGFLGFTLLNLYMIARIGRRSVVISTAAVAIYFFSDNLIDNFPSMTMYYFFAGYWMRHQGSDPVSAEPDPTSAMESTAA